MSRWLWLSFVLLACGRPPPPEDPKRVVSSSSPESAPTLEIASDPDEPEPERPPPPPPPPPPPTVDPCLLVAPSGCQALAPMHVTSDANAGDASRASDGNVCSVWNAGGFAPHSVTIDFGVITRFQALTLIPEMTPNGNVEHVIELSDDGKRFQVAHRIQAPLRSGVAETLRLPKTERARFVRISSKKSPSWIAWREIALFQC